MGRSGSLATLRFVLAVLLSLVAFLPASVRPSTFSVADPNARALAARDAETPVAIEQGGEQCRVSAVRPARDGRAGGVGARDLPLDPIRPPCGAPLPALVGVEDLVSPAGAHEASTRDRARRHAELMVFLI